MKLLTKIFIIALIILPTILNGQNQKEILSSIRFEHLRINVANKEATAKWYVDNVDLAIIPSNNKEVVYVAYSTNDPEKLAERMVYGGSKIVGDVQKLANGDVIIDLVDPYGFSIRLIKRVTPILDK